MTDSLSAGGDRSDLTASLDTETGPVFIKAARGGIYARSLRNEARVMPYVQGIAPALLWEIQSDGWTVLGSEHVEGRHADYAPDSPDLELLGNALERLQRIPLPPHVVVGIERRYSGLAAISGQDLLHSDLHADNVLIGPHQAYIVDWAWACKGQRWAELAMLAFRLMGAGHTIDSAEAWASQFPAWQDGRDLEQFTQANAHSWQQAAQRDPREWKIRAAARASEWTAHRRK